ncbi:hypothetical protein [Brevibacillus sp. SYSU BS000544]|uniref:hypothetical protein n=1 Tax=Brevibacillus sp. SYSU BS000544 TaxID=3416443 RepID=UPI003CE460AD
MPRIGERRTVNAFILDARARGGPNPTTDNPPAQEYFPDDGWVIVDYKVHEEVRRGDATFNVGYQPAGNRIITIDSIEGDLKSRVEWQYAEVWGKGDLDTKWNNTRRQVQEFQRLKRRLVGSARARGERFGAGASIRERVEAVIEYVGTPSDAPQYVNRLLTSSSLPKKIYYLAPRWNGSSPSIKIDHRKTGNKAWNYEASFSNTNPNSNVNMVYQGHGGLVAGLYTFRLALRTEGAPRTVEIAIVEEPEGSDVKLGSKVQTYTISTNKQPIKVSYTKQKGAETDIYTTITWRDTRSDRILLDGNYSFLDRA